MQEKAMDIRPLLQRGDSSLIAKKLGITRQAVNLQLKAGRPGSPAVVEAVRMAKESGALATAQDLATLNPA